MYFFLNLIPLHILFIYSKQLLIISIYILIMWFNVFNLELSPPFCKYLSSNRPPFIHILYYFYRFENSLKYSTHPFSAYIPLYFYSSLMHSFYLLNNNKSSYILLYKSTVFNIFILSNCQLYFLYILFLSLSTLTSSYYLLYFYRCLLLPSHFYYIPYIIIHST